MLEVLKARVEAVRWARAKTIAKQTSPDCLTPAEVGQPVSPLTIVPGSRTRKQFTWTYGLPVGVATRPRDRKIGIGGN